MTGFCGSIAPGGGATEAGVAQAMVAAVARIGPDRQQHWQEGRVLLAHALLATSIEDADERQPLSFDGIVHLVADARIDGREALIRDLRSAGRSVADSAPSSALILHAWHAWGEDCCTRLIGDFAFALWDSASQKLFAARDQFGSVPFYYARAGAELLFGNCVPALLAHPGLDRALNRQAVGDYLMFGFSLDPTAGFYRHIDRLPPAHCLVAVDGDVRTRRYWTLPEADFADQERLPEAALVEQFGALLAQAVRDRTRSTKIATTLSGGMDSTLLTALAMRESKARVDAYSFGADWLAPDNERHWAWQCAHHIGVPFHSVSIEPCFVDPPGGPFRVPPEPRMELKTSSFHLVGDQLEASGTRVLLMGMGGDAIVAGLLNHWTGLFRSRAYPRLLREAWAFWRYHRQPPPLRGAWKRLVEPPIPPLSAPVDPDLVREARLEERWREWHGYGYRDPRRNMATHPFWTEMFVATHPESTGLPLRVRQPFFDVRLLEAAMRLPPAPWLWNKVILRQLGEGLLPDSIVRRPKTAFGPNPAHTAAVLGFESKWLDGLAAAPGLNGLVDRGQLARTLASLATIRPEEYSLKIMLPASLAEWLKRNEVSE